MTPNRPYLSKFMFASVLACMPAVAGLGCAAKPPASKLSASPAPAPSIPRRTGVVGEIEQALKLTEKEQNIVSDMVEPAGKDQPTALPEAKEDFYIYMSKVVRLPFLKKADFHALDMPAYKNLLENPRRYAGKPIRMSVLAFTVKRLTVNNGLRPSIRWPKDKPVWQMQCLNAEAEIPGNQPLTVYATIDPTAILGPAEFNEKNNEFYYPAPGKKCQIAGVFLKNYRRTDRGGAVDRPKLREYPAILAWQVEKPPHPTVSPLLDPRVAIALVIIMAMLVGFLILKRQLRRPGRVGSRKYRPKRPDADNNSTEPNKLANGEVDPALKAAAKQFRQKRQREYEQDHG